MSAEREMRLPMAGTAGDRRDADSGADDAGTPEGAPMDVGVPVVQPGTQPPRTVDVSAMRLVSTLALAGALAGLIIVLVHQWTQPRIEAHQARVLQEAVYEVLGGPERYETAFLVDGMFTTAPPAAADTASVERVYVGFDGSGRPVGLAVVGAEPAFQDVIRLIFGYDPARDRVLGMKVLESKETPGLGDKIEKDSSFVAEFAGVATPLVGVKQGEGDADGEIDMITGATISSRAIVDIINHRLEALREPLAEFWAAGAGSAPPAPFVASPEVRSTAGGPR